MSSELIPQNFGALSNVFAGQNIEDDLSSGIQSSFGIIGYKGKVWSIRYRGDEIQLMRDDGDGPKSSIEVVVLKSSKHISKVWYEAGYVEGSNAAPDCFSNNGVVPEATSVKRQCDTCALCPHNQWGSRITPAGKQGKACADSKRIAVAPLGDVANEMFGGPMLLRVPAASLQDLAMYGQKMQQMGYPYFSVGTRIAFDPAESYPKFKISAIRPLNDEEGELVMSLRDGHTVERILSENEFQAAPLADTSGSVFEQAPEGEAGPAKSTTGTIAKDVAKAVANTAAKAAAEGKKPAPAKEATKKVTTQGNATGFGGSAKPIEKTPEAESPAEPTKQAEPEEQEVESDEDREERELLEKMAALKAKKAAAAKAATQEAAKPVKTEAVSAPAEVDDGGNMASDFEANLDSMLSELLPS